MEADPFTKEQEQPMFVAVRSDDPALVHAKIEAQRTLNLFLALYEEHKSNLGVYFAFKVPVKDGEDVAHLWYSFTGISTGRITGKHFELPPELADRKSIEVQTEDVEDWMINDHGILYGGFSLRYQRSLLSEGQRESFDRYTDVTSYGDIG